MTITVPPWLTAEMESKELPSSVVRDIVAWFVSPDKSVSLLERLRHVSKSQIDERVRRLEITKAEGKMMESLIWSEALRYASMFVSIYLPGAVPDYDHYLGICPYCGFKNDTRTKEKKDFGTYFGYNICCGGCGRTLPFDYLATCPVCNSGCSVPASETARRYMVQSDLWFQGFLYQRLTKPMETPRFDPVLPFVKSVKERTIVPEGTAVVYGIYQDVEHDDFPGVDERYLRSNPPWAHILFYCPYDFFKWSVYLNLEPVVVENLRTCRYCGYPLEESGPTSDGYGRIMKCSNSSCNFGESIPAFAGEVKKPEPGKPLPSGGEAEMEMEEVGP